MARFAATPAEVVAVVTGYEVPMDALLALAPGAPALTDDRPYNECFLLRRCVRPAAAATN